MPIAYQSARDFVYTHGDLWERALFAHLFEGAPLAHVHQCLACYKNPDGGWAHGIEADIKTPHSHALALEFALQIFRTTGINPGNLFNDAPEWLLQQLTPDGFVQNPESVLDYPCASWWKESGGQNLPSSIIGNLTRIGICTPPLADAGRNWIQQNLTLDHIAQVEWLFAAYHPYDYFMHVDDFPNIDAHRQATIARILALTESARPEQYYEFFLFAPQPQNPLAQAAPPALIKQMLDYLVSAQQPTGTWHDEHSLPHWYSWTTIIVLNALKQYGIWQPPQTV